MLVESAPYFLLGLALAGIVWVFLNEANLTRLIGKRPAGAVLRAALIGVPLPLCSCSVLPLARELRQSGLSKGATTSFLIATPESSVDSIILTYSLTDPLMTVARPVTAFITASAAGLLENAFDRKVQPVIAPVADAACPDGCGCEPSRTGAGSIVSRLWVGLRHAFTTLLDDLAPYLLVGFLLAGLVAALLGDRISELGMVAGNPAAAYAGAVLIGVPLYVCATSSTPLAAVFLGLGFPPGAVLVFLMVGPATNIATLVVLKKILGFWSTVRYLLTIVVVAVLFGLMVDVAYDSLGMTAQYASDAHPEPHD